MTDKTYTLELTEAQIKDLASAEASRRVWRAMKPYAGIGVGIVGIISIISFALDTSFLPIGGALIILLFFLYAFIIIGTSKYTKAIAKELINE